MIKEDFVSHRDLKTEHLTADLVVVGGGLAGVCGAITAARAGSRVILVQDRPVLGGNASSEVRLWVLGATSHMGNNNRWAREGGVLDELLVENLYRNPEGNPLLFDTILLEKIRLEPAITLLLNTAVMAVEKSGPDTVRAVRGFCSQNSTLYELTAPLFCDASGDGIVAFQAGAAFRMGAESSEELGEKFAPSQEYGELLGHSIYFYSKDTGKPVRFVPPAFALQDITRIPRYRRFNAQQQGCQLWWLEYGGRLDTVHDTEQIKWELWTVVYGVWNYIKNSGQFPEAETLTLEWVGTIPGKRESRRFEGDYLLRQQDLVEQVSFADAVAFGGWSIDLHPADGVFSEKPGCNQWHTKGLYAIPYRCLYSRNLRNVFLAGRLISASHVAFGSTRVMATGAHVAQAVGLAAALCTRHGVEPRALGQGALLAELLQELLKTGQHIPGQHLHDPADLTHGAARSVSSELILTTLLPDGPWLPLTTATAQLLPLAPGPVPQIHLWVEASAATTLTVELRRSSKPDNHTPDLTLETRHLDLVPGRQRVSLNFSSVLEAPAYAFICLLKNEHVQVAASQQRLTGVLSVFNQINPAVSNYGKQEPTEDIGVDTFEFWCPQRRPAGHNLALTLTPGLSVFGPDNLRTGLHRPTRQPNAWVADPADLDPTLTLTWPTPQTIGRLELHFDPDWDHPLETVLMTHPETVSPFCVAEFVLCDEHNQRLYYCTGNHQARHTIRFAAPVQTSRLTLHLRHPSAQVPASLFEVRCYPD
ncbi:FAD-dependent oxidoreductase [Hymenobacter sp.]|uniref:FAD-dependent oxidoreductase n=1 Tax=Hymenobacter sp. TaxID=1898978 RepID=UPI00286CA186|nr:FAD-dependent oxidoreductase [Hymenobacter sp.]